MLKVKLVRTDLLEDVTFGYLSVDEKRFCATLELPNKDNKPNISCIPFGTYKCKIFNSSSFGAVYQVENVPNREGILIHSGNMPSQIRGCILLGQLILKDKRFITRSKETIMQFVNLTQGKEFELEIVNKADL